MNPVNYVNFARAICAQDVRKVSYCCKCLHYNTCKGMPASRLAQFITHLAVVVLPLAETEIKAISRKKVRASWVTGGQSNPDTSYAVRVILKEGGSRIAAIKLQGDESDSKALTLIIEGFLKSKVRRAKRARKESKNATK